IPREIRSPKPEVHCEEPPRCLISDLGFRASFGFRISHFGFLIVALALVASISTGAALTSEVRLHHGVPALFVNGKLTSQLLAAPYQTGTNDYCDFLKSGTRIFNIYFRFNWTAPEQYDFSRIDTRLDSYLKIDSNALFIGRVLL